MKSDNIVWVNSFTEDAAKKFAESVQKAAGSSTKRPIVVYIDSYGGYVDSLASMIGIMDQTPNPFVTVCIGKAMSCGAVLLSHGDKRFVAPHSRVMIHEIQAGMGGNINDIKVSVAETERLNKHFVMGLLAKNCGKTPKQLTALFAKERDVYMSPEDAVRFKIADAIGIPTVKTTTTYVVS
jgi:ATP-dependent Clp protease, protease subunit